MPEKADQACIACKKQKRKCDKSLPFCELCARVGRPCEYSASPQPPPTAAEFAALHTRLAELEDHLSTTFRDSSSGPSVSGASVVTHSNRSPWISQPPKRFPLALFLDIDCYKWAGLRVPKPPVEVPMEILTILTSQGNTVLGIATDYFSNIHPWIPIVSKKRIDLGIPLRNGGPDLAMLFLAMKLIVSIPEEDAEGSTLYTASKKFLTVLESSGTLSLLCLQAMVLVALYEYGHAIYPAAWMTVGACVRYADIMGLSPDRQAYNILGQCTTWTEAEERRRVWWGIFILDRVIALGSKGRFSAPEPANTDNLPVDDAAWDEGDVSRALNKPISAPFYTPQSPFARLCQSALLVSRAAACSRSSRTPHDSHLANVVALTEDLFSFGTVLDSDLPFSHPHRCITLLAPRCLAWSALFMLLDEYCCPEKMSGDPGYTVAAGAKSSEELEMQMRAMQTVRVVSGQVHDFVLQLMTVLGSGQESAEQLGKMGPLPLDALYCTMATFHWILRESGNEVVRTRLADLERCIGRLGERWRLGMEYLAIGEYHNITSMVPSASDW